MISRMHTLSIKIDAPLESTLATLVKREKVSKSELVPRALQADATQRSGIASTLSASLEMVRDGLLELRQMTAFGPLYVRRRDPETLEKEAPT